MFKILILILFYYSSLAVYPSTHQNFNKLNIKKNKIDSLNHDYSFKDVLGNEVKISDFKGKVILIDLWFTGCGACISCIKSLSSIQRALIDKNIIFISISVDKSKDKWVQSITKDAIPTEMNPWAGKYYSAPGILPLYCGEQGSDNSFVKKYNPNRLYPKLILIDKLGYVVSEKLPRPETSSNELINIINKYL